jgi:peptidoglycan/xylan/chitin deacetylase (PgdA/CDA1 family)
MAAPAGADDKALVAITLDLEMSRNFPTWEQVHWDYHKGDLDGPTKRYTTEVCRRVKARGGRVHCFAVGQVFEQEDVDWLRQIARDGHPVGNHTYDHVNILARAGDDLQPRFKRWPWLLCGRTPQRVILDQVRMTNEAIKARLETTPAGFRSPGGFTNGLLDRADVQKLLLAEGFDWVSSQYPGVKEVQANARPTAKVLEAIARSQESCQPHQYRATGLAEVPMSTVSDIHAFRVGRWPLPDFLKAIEAALDWVLPRRAVFDFLAHPSCLGVVDPECRAVELICDKVKAAGDKAALVDLTAIARRAQGRHQRRE